LSSRRPHAPPLTHTMTSTDAETATLFDGSAEAVAESAKENATPSSARPSSASGSKRGGPSSSNKKKAVKNNNDDDDDDDDNDDDDLPPPPRGTKATPSQGAAPSAPPTAVEFEPPLACVRRILKKTLPSSTNVGKDASAAFARASGIFIIYVTACANDFARENRRQTITANDVLAAIKVGACVGCWCIHVCVCLHVSMRMVCVCESVPPLLGLALHTESSSP
jgi:histone H3/H4